MTTDPRKTIEFFAMPSSLTKAFFPPWFEIFGENHPASKDLLLVSSLLTEVSLTALTFMESGFSPLLRSTILRETARLSFAADNLFEKASDLLLNVPESAVQDQDVIGWMQAVSLSSITHALTEQLGAAVTSYYGGDMDLMMEDLTSDMDSVD